MRYFRRRKARRTGLRTTSEGWVSTYKLSQFPGQVITAKCRNSLCLKLWGQSKQKSNTLRRFTTAYDCSAGLSDQVRAGPVTLLAAVVFREGIHSAHPTGYIAQDQWPFHHASVGGIMTGILPRRQNAMRIPEQASPKQPPSLPRMGEPASGSVNSRTI